MLEQQWQPAGASRPFLNLGLSDNVQVTLDPSRPEGQRVTSVRLDGKPLDPDRTYTVCTFSFLGTGGDNFTAFTSGTTHDTGLVDRDLWIHYLQGHPDLGPDFARQEVDESGMPAFVAGGHHVAFTLGKLDLTSQGSPANTSVTVYAGTDERPRRARHVPGHRRQRHGGSDRARLGRAQLTPHGGRRPVGHHRRQTTLPTAVTATADPITYGTPGRGARHGRPGREPRRRVAVRRHLRLHRYDAPVVNGSADILVHPNGLPPGEPQLARPLLRGPDPRRVVDGARGDGRQGDPVDVGLRADDGPRTSHARQGDHPHRRGRGPGHRPGPGPGRRTELPRHRRRRRRRPSGSRRSPVPASARCGSPISATTATAPSPSGSRSRSCADSPSHQLGSSRISRKVEPCPHPGRLWLSSPRSPQWSPEAPCSPRRTPTRPAPVSSSARSTAPAATAARSTTPTSSSSTTRRPRRSASPVTTSTTAPRPARAVGRRTP